MAKLILDIESDVIDRMERSANKKHLSISEYIKDLFKKYDTSNNIISFENERISKHKTTYLKTDTEFLEKLQRFPISPEVKALTGVLKGVVPDNVDIDEIKWDYLKNKHGL